MRRLALFSVFALLGVTSASTGADDPNPAASKVEPKPADGDAPLAEGFPRHHQARQGRGEEVTRVPQCGHKGEQGRCHEAT